METLALIKTWGEDTIQQELRGMHRTGHIFSVISNKMAAQSFSRTPEQCQTRLKRVKSSFRQCYQNKCVCLQQRRGRGTKDLGAVDSLLLSCCLSVQLESAGASSLQVLQRAGADLGEGL